MAGNEFEYLPLTFKPGVNRDTTEYGAEGTWYSMDKVRFRKGYPQSLNGWQRATPNTFKGIGRFLSCWTTLDQKTLVGVGTNSHMYLNYGGVYKDITPVSASGSLASGLNPTIGSTFVVVSIPVHGREVNDYVKIVTQTATIGGSLYLAGNDYKVVTINSADSFTIDTEVTAITASATSGFSYESKIHSGFQSNNVAFGYGRGGYGSGAWSTPVSSGVIRKLRYWTGGNWGEDLIFSYSNGPIYHWDATNGVDVPGTLISQAPSMNRFIGIDDVGNQVISYGTIDIATSTFDPMLVRWCSDEDYTDWIPSGINTAGDKRLQGGSVINGVQQTKSETLVWTDLNLFSQKFIGTDGYSFEKLGEKCGMMGPNSSVDIGGSIFWMGPNGFWVYNGQVVPLMCTIQKDVFDDDGAFRVDKLQTEKVFCGHNSKFKEVIWLYQSVLSTTDDCDRYIIYNYLEELWSYGTLDRSCWLDAGILPNPIALSSEGNGQMFNHELGLLADNDPIDSYIESAPFDIGDGDELLFVDKFVPDFKLTGSVNITLNFQKYPNAQVVTKGPYTFTTDTTKVDVRGRGRQVSVRIGTSAAGSFWQLGKTRIHARTDGKQ